MDYIDLAIAFVVAGTVGTLAWLLVRTSQALIRTNRVRAEMRQLEIDMAAQAARDEWVRTAYGWRRQPGRPAHLWATHNETKH